MEAAVDGIVRPIRGPKRSALLALLLLEAPRPVTVARLLDELWGDDSPATAVASLQMHVAALRKVVPDRLFTVPGAYVLRTADGEVDAARFVAQAAPARSLRAQDPAGARAVLDQALSLWRGEAFAQVDRTASVAAAVARLEEARLGALEDRAEAALALGRHQELVADLTGMARAQPTRERLAGLLMLALHRSGRSSDALRVYEELCAVLDRDLGVDPNDRLVALHKAIRRGDPALLPTSAGRPGRLRSPAARPETLVAPVMPTGRFLSRPRLLRMLMARFE